MQTQSPINAVIGNKGSGKTLFLVYVAEYSYHKLGKKVFANFELTNIPYEKFTYHQLLTLPEEMKNGVILMDEAHMGADAYNFLSKQNLAITTLATQLRKRNLSLYLTTQRFHFITKRLRDLTDFIFALEEMKDENKNIIHGVARIEMYDRTNPYDDIPIKKFVFDGRKFFGHYNTEELILS